MLKSGPAELNLAGRNSTLLHPEAKSPNEVDAASETDVGACCVTLSRSLSLSGPHIPPSENIKSRCWSSLCYWVRRAQEVSLMS